MTRGRAVIAVVLAVLAAVGCVASWLTSRRTVTVAPVLDGQPATTSVVYDAPFLTLSLLLATVAGVLVVLVVAHRRRPSPPAE
ncbi:hypothetical protein FK535_08005 [Mycolicibacterium sp. 018/SC-01/001]|uniref:hypothetical protein n=1 Tax=Mycolicibacterium sp. 018/SC-01/001 TaxID=2592069 RepID=UPI0011817742|nr:hypothetical protein [Mycolicibacterium sp. 018/SC-01/001]TRW86388.1 hypothetical protein FK535_08005 [Mycolicibacterium sp. 018/SC-01/001]